MSKTLFSPWAPLNARPITIRRRHDHDSRRLRANQAEPPRRSTMIAGEAVHYGSQVMGVPLPRTATARSLLARAMAQAPPSVPPQRTDFPSGDQTHVL